MSEIKTVLFDIGNVLIGWQPERFYDQIMPLAKREAMFAEVDLHGMNDAVDQGQPWKETIYKWADRYPTHRSAIRLWHDRWIEMTGPVIEHSVHLLQVLREKGIHTCALSNFGIESFAFAEKHYPFLSNFDQRFISGHMGVVKPHVPIYQMVEDSLSHLPQEFLFTDDRQENIDTANERGWHTHLFEGSEGWADALVGHGLLTKEEAAL